MRTETRANIGLSGFDWKVVALLFMILDHVQSYFGIFPSWITLLPRFVAPLFVYFLVEGFYHTHSRKSYAFRLYGMAVIMGSGVMLINFLFHNVNLRTGETDLTALIDGHNIFLTLAIFFTILCMMDYVKKEKGFRKIPFLLLTVVFAVSSLAVEGGIYLLPVLLLCYFFYGKKKCISIGILLWSALLLVKAVISYMSGGSGLALFDTLCYDNEWMMALVIIPILFYNGQRGRSTPFAKWMFYIIYPAHLWILMILHFVLKLK